MGRWFPKGRKEGAGLCRPSSFSKLGKLFFGDG